MIDDTKVVLAEPARLPGREFIPKWQHLNRRDRQGLSPGVPCGVFACPWVCEICRINTRVGIAAGAEMR